MIYVPDLFAPELKICEPAMLVTDYPTFLRMNKIISQTNSLKVYLLISFFLSALPKQWEAITLSILMFDD